jgi:hypothetical protein
MKKYFITSALLLVVILTTTACEICGCGHSSFQIGLLPNFNKGFIGLRYSYSTFRSHVKDEPSEYSFDRYQTAELWGGYQYRRFQFIAFLPYVISRKESDDGVTTSYGAGDAMLLVNYKIFGKTSLAKNEKTTLRNELFAGGGIKLPTGVNRVDPSSAEFNIGDFNSQAGTGSVDYMLNATYNFLWNNSGIVTNVAYRFNTANSQEYRFGNRSYINTAYYYTFMKGETKIKPNAGFNYQHNAINHFQNDEVEDSNGYTLNSTLGVNILKGKVGFNAMTFVPVAQENYAGQTKMKSRFLVGLTFSL